MFAVIRIRGNVGVKKTVKDTLEMLRLKATNNCVLVPEIESYKGMIKTAKDFITFGEIDKETLIKMVKKRLRLLGNKRVDKKVLKEMTDFGSFEDFTDALIKGKAKLKDFEKIVPFFRLTPPSKGFKLIKEHHPKGDLGYRGKEINELIEKMI